MAGFPAIIYLIKKILPKLPPPLLVLRPLQKAPLAPGLVFELCYSNCWKGDLDGKITGKGWFSGDFPLSVSAEIWKLGCCVGKAESK